MKMKIAITEKNRDLYLLAGILVFGIIITGVFTWQGDDDIVRPDIVNEKADRSFTELETKINNLSKQKFNPKCYNSFISEIDDSYRQELISADAKENLTKNLKKVYANAVYKQCNFYLKNYKVEYSGVEIQDWLGQLINIPAGDNNTSNHYISQIAAYNYYSKSLPYKVDDFITRGSYDQETYDILKNEVRDMPKLDAAYKSNSKFQNIKQKLIIKLEEFNSDYYSSY